MIAPIQEKLELQETLRRVRRWSPGTRRELMQSITALEDTPSEANVEGDDDDDAPTIDELEGILDNGTPPPTDKECQRWLEEERMRKYG